MPIIKVPHPTIAGSFINIDTDKDFAQQTAKIADTTGLREAFDAANPVNQLQGRVDQFIGSNPNLTTPEQQNKAFFQTDFGRTARDLSGQGFGGDLISSILDFSGNANSRFNPNQGVIPSSPNQQQEKEREKFTNFPGGSSTFDETAGSQTVQPQDVGFGQTGFPAPGGPGTAGPPVFPQNQEGVPFSIDPNDPLFSLSPFINQFFNSIFPGLTQGTFANPDPIQGNLRDLFNSSAIPSNFDEFFKQLTGQQTGFGESGANPFGNQLNQSLLSLLQGGGTNDPTGLSSFLFDPAGAANFSPILQGLQGAQGELLSGNPDFLNNQQPVGATGGVLGALSGIINNQGLDPRFIQAATENLFNPSLEAFQGQLNARGGGFDSPNSGINVEAEGRFRNEFLNNLILNSQGQLNSAIGQGIGLQGQLAGQELGRIGQGFEQQQSGNQNILEALGLGLGREEFTGEFSQQNLASALQFLSTQNQFNLGQQDISASLLQTLLAGAAGQQGGGILGPSLQAGGDILASLIGAGALFGSSLQFKKDIKPVESTEEQLALVDELDLVTFRYRVNDEKEHIGIILEDSDPILATEMGTIDVDIVGVLIGAIQELKKQVKELQDAN